MLDKRVLVDAGGVRVTEVRCPGGHARWSAPEPVTGFGIVLPHRGVFRRRVAGVATLVDRATGYVQVPGTEQEISHPAGGDVCTAIALPHPEDDHAGVPAGPVHLTPRLVVAHRLLIRRACAGADGVELVDLVTELAAAALAPAPRPAHAERRLADAAREILAYQPACPLPELARRLAVSPYHLSRVFHRAVGTTLRRYRLRLRAITAIELLAAGRRDTAMVAGEAGFADQAHLTRTLRAETGLPPTRLRTLLREGP